MSTYSNIENIPQIKYWPFLEWLKIQPFAIKSCLLKFRFIEANQYPGKKFAQFNINPNKVNMQHNEMRMHRLIFVLTNKWPFCALCKFGCVLF